MQGKRAYGLLAGGVVLLIAWLVWRGSRPLEVHVLAPATNVPVTVTAIGNLDAERISAIGFDVEGTISELPLRVGDEVRAGQSVARLDDRRQKLQVAAAQAAVEVAEATLTLKQRVAERARGMETRGTGSRATAIEAEGEAAVARASLRKARVALDQERERLDGQVLLSPCDGVVISLLQAKGAVLPVGTPIMTIAERASYGVFAYVDEARAGMIQPGQLATVVLRSRQEQPIRGKVDRIAPQSDKIAEERRVIIAIDPKLPALYLAEQAVIDIQVGTIERGILVPERIVRERRDADGHVWAVARERLVDVAVKLGRRLGDGRIEITSPLPADTQVIADRLVDVQAGDAVTIATP